MLFHDETDVRLVPIGNGEATAFAPDAIITAYTSAPGRGTIILTAWDRTTYKQMGESFVYGNGNLWSPCLTTLKSGAVVCAGTELIGTNNVHLAYRSPGGQWTTLFHVAGAGQTALTAIVCQGPDEDVYVAIIQDGNNTKNILRFTESGGTLVYKDINTGLNAIPHNGVFPLGDVTPAGEYPRLSFVNDGTRLLLSYQHHPQFKDGLTRDSARGVITNVGADWTKPPTEVFQLVAALPDTCSRLFPGFPMFPAQSLVLSYAAQEPSYEYIWRLRKFTGELVREFPGYGKLGWCQDGWAAWPIDMYGDEWMLERMFETGPLPPPKLSLTTELNKTVFARKDDGKLGITVSQPNAAFSGTISFPSQRITFAGETNQDGVFVYSFRIKPNYGTGQGIIQTWATKHGFIDSDVATATFTITK